MVLRSSICASSIDTDPLDLLRLQHRYMNVTGPVCRDIADSLLQIIYGLRLEKEDKLPFLLQEYPFRCRLMK